MPLPPEAHDAYAQTCFFCNEEANKAKRSKAEIDEDEQKAAALTDEQKTFVERNVPFVVARETQHLTEEECSFVKENATAEEKWWAGQNPPGVPPILELRKRLMGKRLVGEEENGDETVRSPLVDAMSVLSTRTVLYVDFSQIQCDEASLVANEIVWTFKHSELPAHHRLGPGATNAMWIVKRSGHLTNCDR